MPDGPGGSGPAYDGDFYAWTQYQAAVLRSMPCDDNRFDRENVAEEIEDLGRNTRRAVHSEVRRILEHFLKLAYSPAREPRFEGMGSIDNARAELEEALTATLRRDAEAELPRLYSRAGMLATKALVRFGGADAAAKFPADCPYTLDQILDADWYPQPPPPGGNMTRDFIGYGAEPPHARWPNEARIAVNFVINFEEGSELSYPAGDGVSETGLIESASTDAGNRRDLAAESMFEYGSRVGWWRLHRIFTRYKLPVTLFACARALEANPPAAAAIRDSDWDICGHGYRWIKHYELDEAAERDQIARAVALIRETTGKPTEGWYCRYAPSENTRRLVAGHGAFLYDSDAYNDELPYWVRQADKPHLVIPYSLTTNDVKFGRGSFGPGEDFFAYLRDSFDLLYEEGADRPRLMSIGLHMRLTGHPGRAAALIRFIEHISRHDRVWVCRRADIARHWIATHPPG